MKIFTFFNNVYENFINKPATRNYPAKPRTTTPGSRGHLNNDANLCIYCGMCQRKCPADALAVTMKPSKTWTFDPYRCIVCGYCVEVCPKKSLSMNPEYLIVHK